MANRIYGFRYKWPVDQFWEVWERRLVKLRISSIQWERDNLLQIYNVSHYFLNYLCYTKQ